MELASNMNDTQAIPQIRSDVAIFPFDDGTTSQLSLVSCGDRNWKVSPIIVAVLRYIDGRRGAEEIQQLLLSEHNLNFAILEVEQIIIEIRKNGLLYDSDSAVVSTEKKKGMLWGKIPMFSAASIQKVSFLKVLFRKHIFTGLIALATVFLAFIFTAYPVSAISDEIANLNFLNLAFVCALTLLFGVIHEFGHSIALISGGQNPGKIGLGVYYFMPVLFSDVTNAWRLTRTGRILVDIGGVYFQCLALLLAFVLNVIVFHNQLISLAISLSAFQIVFNFSPFLKLDGYWILCDFLGVTSVYETVKNFLLSPFSKRARAMFLGLRAKKMAIVCVYTALLVIFCIYFGDLLIQTCFSTIQTLGNDLQMLIGNEFNIDISIASIFSYIFSRVTHLIVLIFLIRLIILIPQRVLSTIKRKQTIKNVDQPLEQVGNYEND